MSRVYGEPVNVQARDDGRPVRFVWRGRLYTVRAILEHWVINREWWQDPQASGSGSGSEPEPGSEPGSGSGSGSKPGSGSGSEPGQPELEFWRIEAAPGQGMAAGVYELRRDAATDAWTLRPGAS